MDRTDYDLIIFDCDGTLVDSEYPNNLSLVQILAEHGFDGYDMDYALKHWVGRTLTNIFKELEEKDGHQFPDDIIKRCIERTNLLYETELKSVPDALDVVKRVSVHHKICVASNGERNSVKRSLSLSGYGADVFHEDNTFTRIQVPNGKPAPDLFLFAAEKMQAEPSRCLVIEDSPTGVQAAVAAGMSVWGFTGVAHNPPLQNELLEKTGAAQVFDRLIHIAERLGH